ncbi:hypothetical protein D3C80_1917810 [compost metagenome]
MVGGQAEPAVIRNDGVMRHRHQCIMRLIIGPRREEGLVGGDQRNIMFIGKPDHTPLMGAVETGLTLQLDIKLITEE